MTKEQKKIIIFALDKPKPHAKQVGVCVLCDQPVYFLTTPEAPGEATIADLPKLTSPKYIGTNCVRDLIEQFRFFLLLSFAQRDQFKKEYMKGL